MSSMVCNTFGPKYTKREQDRLLDGPLIVHSGCWVNDDWCGDPECVMAIRDEKPEIVPLPPGKKIVIA